MRKSYRGQCQAAFSKQPHGCSVSQARSEAAKAGLAASGTCDGLRICQCGAVHAAPCTPARGKQPFAKAGRAAGLQLKERLKSGRRDLQTRRDGGRLDGLALPPHAMCEGKFR